MKKYVRDIKIKKTFNGELAEITENSYKKKNELVNDYNTFVNYYQKLATIHKQNNGYNWCSFTEEAIEHGRKMVYESKPCVLLNDIFRVEITMVFYKENTDWKKI